MIKNFKIKSFKGLESVEVKDCAGINIVVGKNNAGKSSVLHAIDIACLSLDVGNWNAFHPKLDIKDLFNEIGAFEISMNIDGVDKTIKSTDRFGPQITPAHTKSGDSRCILIYPDTGGNLLRRQHRTPKQTIDMVKAKNFTEVNALEILYAIKFYASRNENGFTPDSYKSLVQEVINYFPDLTSISSDRTEHDIATLTYEEYGKKLDILYSGTGLKHFIDILIKSTLSKAKIILLDEPEMGLHPDLQRRFIDYISKLAQDKGIQFFISTHSPVFLNYSKEFAFYRMLNTKGKRQILKIDSEATHTVLSDLGIRPSDLFNQDICLLVEGASEVVFFEHIIRNLYKSDFEKIGVGIIQYGGGAADGIISGSISVSNIVSSQKYTLWLRDRDAPEGAQASAESTKFATALERENILCKILEKREIEYYYPEVVHIAAQDRNTDKEQATKAILVGNQSGKYRDLAKPSEICVPKGKFLKDLLQKHVTSKDQLAPEIRDYIETILIPWKKEILGET